jgi:SH3-like domain-containing protein
MRVGPSEAYPIEWVYRRQGLPVKVVRVMQGWRLVEGPAAASAAGSSPACSTRRAEQS